MPTYDIAGIPVVFPYDAYEPQLLYMKVVITALQRGENALVESPTGTGKTLCLLCATLAWRSAIAAQQQLAILARNANYDVYTGQQPVASAASPSASASASASVSVSASMERLQAVAQTDGSVPQKIPLIVYASRTHSQLSQVVSELRKTAYRPKFGVVGSREQMCTNPSVKDLKSNGAMTTVCMQLVRKNCCEPYTRVGEAVKRIDALKTAGDPQAMMDIEDVVKLGGVYRACPFYVSREGLLDADLVVMPYNYLVDRKTKNTTSQLDLAGAIIIFDEAHNVENTCGEASSTEICTADLEGCIRELAECRKTIESGTYLGPVSLSAVETAQTIVGRLLGRLWEIELDREQRLSSHGEYIFDFCQRAGVNGANVKSVLQILDQLARAFIENEYALKKKYSACSLQLLENALRTIFKPSDEDDEKDKENGPKAPRPTSASPPDSKYFRVHVEAAAASPDGKTVPGRTISYWCFNPGIALGELQARGVRSIVLTSGTLSPLASFTTELQLPFPHQLENAHVISSDQVFCSVVKTGPTGHALNSSYQTRDSDSYKAELGRAVLEVCKSVPQGLLVFFPSYSVMDACIGHWRKRGERWGPSLFEQIASAKFPVIEPKSKGDLSAKMKDYYRHAMDANGPGAVFFAICRGKVSEGLDFSDGKGRAVIVTGIPYPPLRDPKVVLKRQYLEDLAKDGRLKKSQLLTGDEWYSQQASRAVNQAIGRVIRHRNDFGAILLFDDRFASPKAASQLSLWLRPHIAVHESFAHMQSPLCRFFSNKQAIEARSRLLSMAPQCEPTRGTGEVAGLDRARKSIFEAQSFFTNSAAATSATATLPAPKESTNSSTQKNGDGKSFIKVFGPADPPKPVSETRTKAQAYLEKVTLLAQQTEAQVKSHLPAEAVGHFNTVLRSYRAHQTEVAELILRIAEIFDACNAQDLLQGFRHFVPTRHWDLFDKLTASKPAASVALGPEPPNTASRIWRDREDGISADQSRKRAVSLDEEGGSVCPVCRGAVKNGYTAKCGHVCCFPCWSSWLQVKLECPLCQNRTRIPQLKKAPR